MTIVLEARKLTRALGEKVKQTVLHGVDLSFGRGELVAVTGASGSGKSTLLYLLGALDRPTSGQVFIDGVEVSALDDDERSALRNEKLGFVFQFHFLLPEFTVTENIMIPMLRRGVSRNLAEQRAHNVLASLDIEPLKQRKPKELSGGQQQRVSIARACANQPMILLADEPTGALDTRNGELVVQLFEKLNRDQGMTVLIVTHDQEIAKRASRRVVLQDGRVI